MAHTVFQTAQIMPINTHFVPTVKTLSSAPSNPLLPVSSYRVPPLTRKGLTVKNSSAIVDGESVAGLERCFRMSPTSTPECPPSSSSAPSHGPMMKGGQFGAFGAVTLEKSKLDMTQKQSKSSPELAIGGGGGNIGKSINFGGGDGGDDDGDDDDYFDEFDDGDEGDDGGLFRRRIILPELFDRKFLEAVLNEWSKTMMDLPSGLRQAYEMGLVSSAQLVRYIAINARPTTARFISRSLPQSLSRGFIGRMIADPAFLYRILLEQAATIGSSVLYEVKNRKERRRVVYGGVERRAVQGGLSNLVASKKKGRLSVTIPTVSTNALGYGAFLGIYANLRYQLLSGFDRAMVTQFDVIGVGLAFSTALRIMNAQLGETSRLAWLGVEVDPLAHSDELLKQAYNRPSESTTNSSPKWFISKNAVTSLLGFKQGQSQSQGQTSGEGGRHYHHHQRPGEKES